LVQGSANLASYLQYRLRSFDLLSPGFSPQVFRPYVPLPTISVEQQGAMELAAAREREASQAAADAARSAREEARRSEDEDEEEVARARAWDAFKDENPAGWGNSKLRPCA
jgi:hypothetical protein